jgi:hypothetical protein
MSHCSAPRQITCRSPERPCQRRVLVGIPSSCGCLYPWVVSKHNTPCYMNSLRIAHYMVMVFIIMLLRHKYRKLCCTGCSTHCAPCFDIQVDLEGSPIEVSYLACHSISAVTPRREYNLRCRFRLLSRRRYITL